MPTVVAPLSPARHQLPAPDAGARDPTSTALAALEMALWATGRTGEGAAGDAGLLMPTFGAVPFEPQAELVSEYSGAPKGTPCSLVASRCWADLLRAIEVGNEREEVACSKAARGFLTVRGHDAAGRRQSRRAAARDPGFAECQATARPRLM